MSDTTTQRPDFVSAWGSFRAVYGDGTVPHVANFLGGKVKVNIDGGIFKNACAIRMSYVLNQAGIRVPAMSGKTVSGGDASQYLYKVKDLVEFLRLKLGTPDRTVSNPAPSDFAGDKGLLVFDVQGWSDATGHATLWDGVTCSDHCYFPNAQQAHFWQLK